MSKFERYKKTDELEIYPHRHCKICNKMIDESIWYCPECYKKKQEKKKRRWFSRKKSSETSEDSSNQNKKKEKKLKSESVD